jgi:hypothetical protein
MRSREVPGAPLGQHCFLRVPFPHQVHFVARRLTKPRGIVSLPGTKVMVVLNGRFPEHLLMQIV